jgi:hypothetical protein
MSEQLRQAIELVAAVIGIFCFITGVRWAGDLPRKLGRVSEHLRQALQILAAVIGVFCFIVAARWVGYLLNSPSKPVTPQETQSVEPARRESEPVGAAPGRSEAAPPVNTESETAQPVNTETVSTHFRDEWLSSLAKTIASQGIRRLAVPALTPHFYYEYTDPHPKDELDEIVRRFNANLERELEARLGSTTTLVFPGQSADAGGDATMSVDVTWLFHRQKGTYHWPETWKVDVRATVTHLCGGPPAWIGYLVGARRQAQSDLYFE